MIIIHFTIISLLDSKYKILQIIYLQFHVYSIPILLIFWYSNVIPHSVPSCSNQRHSNPRKLFDACHSSFKWSFDLFYTLFASCLPSIYGFSKIPLKLILCLSNIDFFTAGSTLQIYLKLKNEFFFFGYYRLIMPISASTCRLYSPLSFAASSAFLTPSNIKSSCILSPILSSAGYLGIWFPLYYLSNYSF